MKKYGTLIFLLTVIIPLHGIELSGAEFGLGFHPEYTRSFHYSWDFFAFGRLELNDSFFLGAGIAAGKTWDVFDIDAYAFTEFAFPFFRKYLPVNVKFSYIYNGLPAYQTHIHTLLPVFSVNWRWLGFSAGETLRFTCFGGGPAIFEPILAYSVYVSPFNSPGADIRISLANFDDFTANNLGSYFFALNSRFAVGSFVSISSELKVAVSGNVGRITSVYGISVKQGIVFRW